MLGQSPCPARRLELIASRQIGLIEPGADLADVIVAALARDAIALEDGDVLVLAQKIVSKAQGRFADLEDVEPSRHAHALAARCGKDARLVELILQESVEVVRCVPGVIIVRNRQGLVLANAGIDRSNVEQGNRGERVLLLPRDPDSACAQLRERFRALTGRRLGVIINDSIGRAWRKGTQGTAIGVAGLPAVRDMRGQPDLHGFMLRTTEVGWADEIASAASLLMGQSDEGTPVVLVRGLVVTDGEGKAADIVRPRAQDLFP